MTFTGAELFTVTNGTSPPCRKRLVDMDAFEVLMVANWFAKTFPETSAALFAWQAKMRHNPRRAPPDAA